MGRATAAKKAKKTAPPPCTLEAASSGTVQTVVDGRTFVLEDMRPDLPLILDLPVQVGLERAGLRGGAEARFEAKGHAFHQRLRDRFLEIAKAEPNRCVVLDSAQTPDAVSDAVWSALAARLPVGPHR